MRSGELQHRLRIEERLDHDQDATGDVQEEWVLRAEVWGNLEPLSGREFFAAQQTNAVLTATARLRYLAGLSDQDRVIWIDPRSGVAHVFSIIAVIDRALRHREHELMLEEVPTHGPARNA